MDENEGDKKKEKNILLDEDNLKETKTVPLRRFEITKIKIKNFFKDYGKISCVGFWIIVVLNIVILGSLLIWGGGFWIFLTYVDGENKFDTILGIIGFALFMLSIGICLIDMCFCLIGINCIYYSFCRRGANDHELIEEAEKVKVVQRELQESFNGVPYQLLDDDKEKKKEKKENKEKEKLIE